MPRYRSRTTMEGRRMAAARSLWRATGLNDGDFAKPLVAVVNSYTQFVPGHVHLREPAALVAEAVWAAGGVPREMNTIAIDDGIAMGHGGMLYSLPSRELIADSIEYMINGHCVDAMVCISNCDKITPGMLLAAMRLNIPAVFVSGGPMEAGKAVVGGQARAVDLIDAMVAGADPATSDADLAALEASACPTCGSCSGMFTANSMNCLAEALGLALPGNGTLLATHALRRELFAQAGTRVVDLARRWYEGEDARALPRSMASAAGFRNAMALDIAMGGSTNTVLHLLAMAREGEVAFGLDDIDRLSREVPHLCKVAPSTARYHIEDVHRAGGIPAIMGELRRLGLIDGRQPTVHAPTVDAFLDAWDIASSDDPAVARFFRAAPGGVRTTEPYAQERYHDDLDRDRAGGCIRDLEGAYSRDGGLAVLSGNLAPRGAIVKSAGVPGTLRRFSGPARVFDSQEAVTEAILGRKIAPGSAVVVRYEGPKGGPGMQEMLYPSSYLRSMGLAESCALITDGRFSGGSAGLSVGHVSPEAAERGAIGLVADGDIVSIDIAARSLTLEVGTAELERRAAVLDQRHGRVWRPHQRERAVSKALELYGLSVSSASEGAVRNLDWLKAAT